jgi:hypothetical protein
MRTMNAPDVNTVAEAWSLAAHGKCLAGAQPQAQTRREYSQGWMGGAMRAITSGGGVDVVVSRRWQSNRMETSDAVRAT